jgi:hypothetical protein
VVDGKPGIHLSRRTRTWINCVGLSVWFTGVGWMAVHYLFEPRDAANFRGNSEPLWLKWHGAFAVLAIWTGGLLWGLHIVKAWRQHRHRWSGGSLAGALLLLIVSGYLLYYVADDRARSAISSIHQVVGVAILLAYLIHRLAKKSFRRHPRR